MTDVLGVMESWSDGVTAVRHENGTVSKIRLADIVSGKPVPPRPSPRMRVSAEQACRMANASWPPLESEALGQWLLRASGGFSARANSVMATGDPGVPLEAALGRVREFYADRDLPAWAQVVVGTGTAEAFEAHGWQLARPGEADSEFQVASVAQAVRAVRRRLPRQQPPVTLSASVTSDWLAGDDRARAHRDAAVAVLEGPEQVGFLAVGSPLVAKGRVACDGDWAGITDVW